MLGEHASTGQRDPSFVEVDPAVVQESGDADAPRRDLRLAIEVRLTRGGERMGVGVEAASRRPDEALDRQRVASGVRQDAVRPRHHDDEPVRVDGGIVVRHVRAPGMGEPSIDDRPRVRDEVVDGGTCRERRGYDLLAAAGLEPVRARAVDDVGIGGQVGSRQAARDIVVRERPHALHHLVRETRRLQTLSRIGAITETDGGGIDQRGHGREDDRDRDHGFDQREAALVPEPIMDPSHQLSSAHRTALHSPAGVSTPQGSAGWGMPLRVLGNGKGGPRRGRLPA